jgi:hypothetical protein
MDPSRRSLLLDRGAFLRLGAASAAAAAGGLAASPPAAAAPPVAPAGEDLGFVQFTVSAKLVALELHDRVAAARLVPARERPRLAALRAGDAAHLRRVAFSLGDERPRRADFTYAFPPAALRSRAGALAELAALEELTAGVGLLAAGFAQDPGTRLLLARVAAADASHLGELRVLQGRPPARSGLPDVPGFEEAAARLDRYLRPTVPLPPED